MLSDRPGDWERLLEALGMPALLVLVEERMGTRLKQWYQPEDVLQEGLLHAWRDRERLEWRGIAAFRRWFLQVLENRLRDLADHAACQKRGGAEVMVPLTVSDECSDVPEHVVALTTTPGRRAVLKEQAEILRQALHALPEDLQPVVRLRLLEEKTSAEVATELGIGLSAVKHRLRVGAGLIRQRLDDEHARSARGT